MGFFKNLGLKKKSSKGLGSSQSSTSTSDVSPTSSVASTPKAKRNYVAQSGPLAPLPYVRGTSFDKRAEEDEEAFPKPALTDSRLQNGYGESSDRTTRREEALARLQRVQAGSDAGDSSSSRGSLKGTFRGLLNHHNEKPSPPARTASVPDRPNKHRKNPSLETILRNMYPADMPRSGQDSDEMPTALPVAEPIKDGAPRATGSRSGQLAPRDFTQEVETMRVTKSRSGVLSPRDWQDAPIARAPRSGQLSPVDSIPENGSSVPSALTSRSSRKSRELLQGDSASSGTIISDFFMYFDVLSPFFKTLTFLLFFRFKFLLHICPFLPPYLLNFPYVFSLFTLIPLPIPL